MYLIQNRQIVKKMIIHFNFLSFSGDKKVTISQTFPKPLNVTAFFHHQYFYPPIHCR